MGVAGLVLGIVSAVGGFIPFLNYGAWVIGVVGIILSAIAMKKAKAAGQPAGLAVAGLVLSIIGTVISIIGCVCIVICAGAAAGLSGY